MHLLAPWWHLGFFALAAIPVIIYLLFRRRKRDVSWGATYILRRLLESKSKTNLWKQYLIIALRTLAVAALALAFLWPHRPWRAPRDGRFPRPQISTHRLILLDTSMSMEAASAGGGGGACLDAALSFCRKALESGAYPGRVDVLPMDGRQDPIGFENTPVEPAQIERFAADLPRKTGPADFEQGLHAATTVFRGSHYRFKELFLLSDFSARDLQDGPAVADLLSRLRQQGVRIFLLNFANPQGSNCALLDFSPDMDLLLAGQPTLFYVTVGCFGLKPTTDTWLTIRDGKGNALYDEAVTLAPGQKTLEIPLALPAGEQELTAVLRDDDLLLDNTLTRSFHVEGTLRVLVAQDINLADGFENPRQWVKLALGDNAAQQPVVNRLRQGQEVAGVQPAADSNDKAARYAVDAAYVNSAQINAALLADRHAVVLLDVGQLSEDALADLQRYIIRGGAVLLAPGPAADALRFNKTFAAFAPLQLAPPPRTEIDPEVYDHAVLEAAGNRLLREIESTQHGDIGSSRFYNHYPQIPDSLTSQSEALFSLSNGSPLLARRVLGRGMCLLWTAGLGMQWQSMVVHPVYPMFFSRLFNVAAARQNYDLNLAPGQPIIASVLGEHPLLITPEGKRLTLDATRLEERWMVRYEQTQAGGVYRLLNSAEDQKPAATFSVRQEQPESDYRTLGPAAASALEEAAQSPLFPGESQLFAAVGASYPGPALAPWIALIMLALLVAEAALARRWFP